MKLRIIFIVLGFLCFALILASCRDGKKNVIEDQIIGFTERTSPYFFSGIITPQSIEAKVLTGDICQDYSKKNDLQHLKDTKAIYVFANGSAVMNFSQREAQAFRKQAEKIGDIPRKEGYIHTTPVDHITLYPSIDKIELRAVSDYNEHYKSGSDLGAIAYVRYNSFSHMLDKSLQGVLDLNSSCITFSSLVNHATDIKHIAIINPEFSQGAKTVAKNGVMMKLSFTEKPTTDLQTISVEITLDNGTKLQASVTGDLR